jgi:hypothetical protein
MKLRNVRVFVRDNWIAIGLHVLLFSFLAACLIWRLGDLTPGYAGIESATYHASTPLKAIFDNPLNAPFTLIEHALLFLNKESLFLGRTVAVGFSLLTLAIFYILVRNWHGGRIAFFATLLFGTSALFLHTARLGSPVVLYYLLFLLMAAGFWLKQRRSAPAIFFVCLVAALLLYVPGMIILLVIGAIWQWRVLDRIFKEHLAVVSVGALLFTAAIAPLAWALYRTPDLLRVWAGLPAGGWPEIMEVVKNALLVPVHIFIKGAADPVTWLGTAPLLDIFTIGMLAVGLLTYCYSIRLRRTQLLIAFFILLAALIGLGGSVTLVVLLPFLYILVAGGLYAVLNEWLTVFPRNPLARGVGIGLLSLVVLIASTYHLRHYFVGWPQARATHDTFIIQKP